MSKVKVKGDGFKTFECELKDLNLTERAEINDLIFDTEAKKNFSFWLDIIKRGTSLSDDELNKYSNDEIYGLGASVIVEMNKKKQILFYVNVWISIKGIKGTGDNGFEYPYEAISPVDGTKKTFISIDDVYGELLNCYAELKDKGVKNISETIYVEHFYFANTFELIDKDIQQRIKEYNFCKSFSVPPYPSLNETPAKVVDDFLEIEHIMLNIKKEKNVS